MKRSTFIFLLAGLLSCSPYKKVTLTMSDRLTERWKGAPEAAVLKAMGSSASRATQPDGYFLRFDYSYLLPNAARNNNGFQVKVSNQPNTFTPRSDNSYPANTRNAGDSTIRRLEFYFDQAHHVQYVQATGYPDSVYYVKRRVAPTSPQP